jgi:hypothetical protein
MITSHEGLALAPLPLKRNNVPIVQKAGLAPGAAWITAENLVPTPEFNPQTFQPIASQSIHVIKSHKGSKV